MDSRHRWTHEQASWFEAWFPQSKFHAKLAKPLLSLRTTGSMSVERVAKHLKVAVYTKLRNRLECGNKKMLLRTGNLRFLSGMKVALKTTRSKFNLSFFESEIKKSLVFSQL